MERKNLIKAIADLGLSVLYYKEEALFEILSELQVMRVEIERATPGYRQFTPKEIGGGITVTGVKSDFPQWFYRIGFKKREQVYTAYKGRSKYTKHLVFEAIERLREGHCDFHEPCEPYEYFLYLIGELAG